MRSNRITVALAVALVVLAGLSLFVGVIELDLQALLRGDGHAWEIFLLSRLPRLLAILCTGAGMSVAGLIMQQLCSNKFVSPTTGATISSAQLGILLALLFWPGSTLWGRALLAFAAAIAGTWAFVWFIQRIQFKDAVMVPLVGIMFSNVIGGVTSYLAYQYEMTQALSSWLVGHFSLVIKGRYEIVWLTAPLILLAFVFANHFNIVGLGRDFSKNLGVPSGAVHGAEHLGHDHCQRGGCGGLHFLHRADRTQSGGPVQGGSDPGYAGGYRSVRGHLRAGVRYAGPGDHCPL